MPASIVSLAASVKPGNRQEAASPPPVYKYVTPPLSGKKPAGEVREESLTRPADRRGTPAPERRSGKGKISPCVTAVEVLPAFFRIIFMQRFKNISAFFSSA